MDTKEEVTEATTKPVDTLLKVTARLSVLFVVVTLVVFTGIVTLSKRSVDAAEDRAEQSQEISEQTQEIEELQNQLVCFAERSERFSSAVSVVLTTALSGDVDNFEEPDQQEALRQALVELENYRDDVANGTLDCVS